MGMESYYITLDIKELKFSHSLNQCFKQRYRVSKYKIPSGKLFQKSIVDDRRFVIDGKAVVAIMEMQDHTEITFELCFSNFEENLSYVYKVAQWVSSLGVETKLIVLNSDYDFSSLDCKKLKEIVSESYHEKLQQFRTRYGNMNADILPNEFYQRIGRMDMIRKRLFG